MITFFQMALKNKTFLHKLTQNMKKIRMVKRNSEITYKRQRFNLIQIVRPNYLLLGKLHFCPTWTELVFSHPFLVWYYITSKVQGNKSVSPSQINLILVYHFVLILKDLRIIPTSQKEKKCFYEKPGSKNHNSNFFSRRDKTKKS